MALLSGAPWHHTKARRGKSAWRGLASPAGWKQHAAQPPRKGRQLPFPRDHLRHRQRPAPALAAMVENQRHDRRQRPQARCAVPGMALPDAHHVAEHLQRRTRIGRRLVLQQHVYKRRAAVLQTRLEQPVAVALVQHRIHEARIDQADRGVRQFRSHCGRQILAYQRLRPSGVCEQRSEQRIMRRGRWQIGHRLRQTYPTQLAFVRYPRQDSHSGGHNSHTGEGPARQRHAQHAVVPPDQSSRQLQFSAGEHADQFDTARGRRVVGGRANHRIPLGTYNMTGSSRCAGRCWPATCR